MPPSRHQPIDRKVDLGDRSGPIFVRYESAKKYYRCKNYEGTPGLNWIEIWVHHEGVLNFAASSQKLILNALFDAVDGQLFLPVNYQSQSHVDYFLVRTCTPALDNLFKRGLRIQVSTGAELYLTVWFNVAEHKFDQILPVVIISQVIGRLMDNLETYQGVQGVLNLSNFSANPSFKHIVVRLSNLATFQLVCTTIFNNDDRRLALNGFSLAHNQISDLSPLKLFGDIDYDLLDLTGNMISSAKRLCTNLERFRAKQLNLAYNPIIKQAKYPDCLKPLIKNFKIVDDVPIDKLYKKYTPLNYEIDVDCDGTRIDCTNKPKLEQFRQSEDWHAFLIPDAMQEFSKDDLFNIFFILVSPELSEFYPCYHKFADGEHKFLVRDCFDQIEHFAYNCNLEMKMLTAGAVGELSNERTIPYYLRMNVSPFKSGHVEPKKCIQVALEKRFNAINRVLNLEEFQKAEGLDNVILCMTSPKILNSILRVASRKFLGNCIELKLGNNKILGLNNMRTLSLLTSLQALDLGHNWIYDLSSISALSDVPLKALRLHGNPMCLKYGLPSEYIKAVKDICPGLLRLDNVDLDTKPGLASQKDYICDPGAYELIGELFLYPFLREFEQLDQRINLMRFYSDKSLFSMQSSYDINRCPRPSNELFKRINKYNYFSRNLLKYSQDTCRIHVGSQDILEVLMQLPAVTHDYVSLQTNVLHYDTKSAVIFVTGVLRDEPDLLLGFSRQFVLKVDEVGLGIGKRARRMKIVNETLTIMNPAKKQIKDAFKIQEPTEHFPKQEKDESVDDLEHKLCIFKEISGLRPRWCTRIVQEEANWDFQLALEKFIAMEASNELPDGAFI